jgi:transposase
LSLIAAIAPNGRLYLAGQDHPFTSENIVWFLSKLCWHYRRQNLLLIWDGAAIHRSQAVKDWLISKPGRVHLERLPTYSPELNPVELVWSQLKRSLKNQTFSSLKALQNAVLNQAKQLHADPKLITSFFRKREVAFFTN